MVTPMKTEKHEHKGHKIRVSCEERGPNGDLYWRVSIRKNGVLKKHDPGLKPFDTPALAVAEGKTWAENWVDVREELK